VAIDGKTASVLRELLDVRSPTPAYDGPQVGTVVTVAGGAVTFTLDDPSIAYGPVPYSAGSPVRGSQCLVVFVGNGTDQPWVLAFR
jgi:hypothetical protein